jgi:hypothetical protein
MGVGDTLRWAIRRSWDIVTDKDVRRSWFLAMSRPANLFQPYVDTCPDRYPEIFGFLQRQIEPGPNVRLLSFGCSQGDEVFSLRTYFPEATIVGIDISRGNIRECRRRRRKSGDERIEFVRAGTASRQPEGFYDAVLCLAVLRHGDLGVNLSDSCADLITFEAFDQTVRELALSVRVGGYLVIEHSNFRFCDSSCAARFQPVAAPALPSAGAITPLFGRDNVRLMDPEYRDVVFRKER